MSYYVPGVGFEPDPRVLDRDNPKAVRRYKRASRLFRGATKAYDLIQKLRKRKKQQKGTPKANRIQQRINRLKERKERLLEKSRNIKSWGKKRPPSDRDKRGDRDRDRDRDRGRGKDIVRDRVRDRDRDRDIVRDRDRDRGRKSTGGFFSGKDKDRSTREDRGTRPTGGFFGGKDKDSDFSKVKDRSGRVYYRSRGNKDDWEERR